MDFIILSSSDKIFYRQTIIEMMEESDNDFIPPLSKRTSTTQQNLLEENVGENSVIPYFNQMNEQMILGAFEEENLLGFVSFKENYVNEIIEEKFLPNIYLSTLILKKEARGRGLTQKMYDFLFNNLYPDRSIFTRTWSTNFAHLKILSKFGFQCIKTIPNDRGNQIDTVYFAKFK